MTDAFDLVERPLPHYVWRTAGARAVFTLREGGVSSGALSSLNLGLHCGDQRVNVGENRRRVAEAMRIERSDVRSALQVHGAHVWHDDDADPGMVPWSTEPPVVEADALIASHGSGHTLAIMVADCTPIAIVTADGVAAVHAGWRSLASGILERVAGRLDLTGAAAAIGPCIGPCCFEVGESVADRFDPADIRRPADGAAPHATTILKPRVDLRAAATRRLQALGVERIDVLDICTSCSPRCFSHRRDFGDTGRQAMLVVPRV